MIKNLVTSGCSFTESINQGKSWASELATLLQVENHVNMAKGAAGNVYICNSIIDCLETKHFDPRHTLVLVMWSGPDRKDVLVSGEYWYLLNAYPNKIVVNDPDGYWIFSGGRGNSWQDFEETRKLFEPFYVSSDPHVMCKETLRSMLHLQSYLLARGYLYRFMSYMNYFLPDLKTQSIDMGSLNIPFFSQSIIDFQNLDFTNWIFWNKNKDTIYEFCRTNDLIGDDNCHPSKQGHKQYAEQVLLPVVRKILEHRTTL